MFLLSFKFNHIPVYVIFLLLMLQFLGDTFNALFAIMEEMAEEVGDLVFEALVQCIFTFALILLSTFHKLRFS